MTCPWCGDDRLAMLGQLGRIVWLRCMACGSDVGVAAASAEEIEDEREEDDLLTDGNRVC